MPETRGFRLPGVYRPFRGGPTALAHPCPEPGCEAAAGWMCWDRRTSRHRKQRLRPHPARRVGLLFCPVCGVDIDWYEDSTGQIRRWRHVDQAASYRVGAHRARPAAIGTRRLAEVAGA